MVALTEEAHAALTQMLSERVIERTYAALVEGNVQNSVGAVDAPIARSATDYRKMVISAGGKPSATNFVCLSEFENATLLECKLESGRTHQIRVHMSSIGHPVYGDKKYGSKHDIGDRFFLHAKALLFNHPVTDELLTFEASLPADLEAVIEKLD